MWVTHLIHSVVLVVVTIILFSRDSAQHVSQNRISCENKNTAVYSNASYQYEYVSAKQDDSDNYENNTVYEMCDSHEIDNYENNTAYEMCDSRSPVLSCHIIHIIYCMGIQITFSFGMTCIVRVVVGSILNLPQPNLPKNQLVLNQVQTAFKEQRTDEEDQMRNDYNLAMSCIFILTANSFLWHMLCWIRKGNILMSRIVLFSINNTSWNILVSWCMKVIYS
jgi:hypothetical protein